MCVCMSENIRICMCMCVHLCLFLCGVKGMCVCVGWECVRVHECSTIQLREAPLCSWHRLPSNAALSSANCFLAVTTNTTQCSLGKPGTHTRKHKAHILHLHYSKPYSASRANLKCTHKVAHMHASLINTYVQRPSSPCAFGGERKSESVLWVFVWVACVAFETNNITLNWQFIQSSPSLSADVVYWRISSPAWHSCCSESWRWLQQHVPLGTEPHHLHSQATGPSWGSQLQQQVSDQLRHAVSDSCSTTMDWGTVLGSAKERAVNLRDDCFNNHYSLNREVHITAGHYRNTICLSIVDRSFLLISLRFKSGMYEANILRFSVMPQACG